MVTLVAFGVFGCGFSADVLERLWQGLLDRPSGPVAFYFLQLGDIYRVQSMPRLPHIRHKMTAQIHAENRYTVSLILFAAMILLLADILARASMSGHSGEGSHGNPLTLGDHERG
jgi:hypothetical protein